MSAAQAEVADRWRALAAGFGRRVDGVERLGPTGWEASTPCAGWVARDVVAHVVEWMPALFFSSAGLEHPAVPPVADDPVAAWRCVATAVQAALDDPAVARLPTQSQAGSMAFDELVAMTGLMDLLVHTWDLARATGQDESLDPGEVGAFLEAIEPWDAALRSSGHYGARVDVPADASDQERLLAFTGRRP